MDDNHVLTDPKVLVREQLKNKGIDLDKIKVPKRVYLAMDGILEEFIKRDVVHNANIPLCGELYVFNENENIGLIEANMCSPAIAIQTENLVAGGIKELIHLGYAGGIQSDLKIGQVVITNGAYNDTAIARLYGYDENIIYSDKSLTVEIKKELIEQNLHITDGLHWTTDAGYHETWGEIKKYRSKNALCVEMEAVGLFTIARYRNVKATGIYVISDVFDDKGWHVGWAGELINKAVSKLVDAIISNL